MLSRSKGSELQGVEFCSLELEEMKELNKYYLGRDEPTDIITFPLYDHKGRWKGATVFVCEEYVEKMRKCSGEDLEDVIGRMADHILKTIRILKSKK